MIDQQPQRAVFGRRVRPVYGIDVENCRSDSEAWTRHRAPQVGTHTISLIVPLGFGLLVRWPVRSVWRDSGPLLY
jgi:hypothetical protein